MDHSSPDGPRRGVAVGPASAAAWRAAVERARTQDDPAALARAALAWRASDDLALNADIHALCTEVLHRLDPSETALVARVRAQRVATASPFLLATVPVEAVGPAPADDDPEALFLWLQARHAEEAGIQGLAERVRLADAAVGLGRRTGVEEYVCWGRRWRLDTQLTLGDAVGATAELEALRPLVDRRGDPGWQRHLALVRAVRHEVLGEFAAARRLVDEAVALDPGPESAFFALVVRADVACLTGVDLDEATAAVEARVAGLPYFARGWSARMAMAQGRREDVELWWRTLVPHLDAMPPRAPEWIVAQVGHAELCCWLGDVEVAAALYALLAAVPRAAGRGLRVRAVRRAGRPGARPARGSCSATTPPPSTTCTRPSRAAAGSAPGRTWPSPARSWPGSRGSTRRSAARTPRARPGWRPGSAWFRWLAAARGCSGRWDPGRRR